MDSMEPSISLPTAGTLLCDGFIFQGHLWFTCLAASLQSYSFFFILQRKISTLWLKTLSIF